MKIKRNNLTSKDFFYFSLTTLFLSILFLIDSKATKDGNEIAQNIKEKWEFASLISLVSTGIFIFFSIKKLDKEKNESSNEKLPP